MGVKQLKVDVKELSVGMFVSKLDRPWTQTPFPLQGFYIRDLDEINQLKHHCQHVYIDIYKGVSPEKTSFKQLKVEQPDLTRRVDRLGKRSKFANLSPLKIRRNIYLEVTPVEKEIGKANALKSQVLASVASIMESISHDRVDAPVNETRDAASQMVDSVVRSPDAFSWLARVRDKDEHTYSHAVRSAVWALLFGRQIGLPKSDLDVLALGVLLKDIGKAFLPKHLLEQTTRNVTEQAAYEKFVTYGVDVLRKTPDVQPRVTSVVKTHCERVNGSGFPARLSGDKIPLLGKIAGIVTFYDETINPRGKAKPVSPSKAVAKLYELRDVQFQEELVVEFIRAIGLYPTGTLVELSGGQVAVVVEQNFERRLKPKVMIVIDEHGDLLNKPAFMDLASIEQANNEKIDAGKASFDQVTRVEIVKDLEPDAYEIDVLKVLNDYLSRRSTMKKVSWVKRKIFRIGKP